MHIYAEPSSSWHGIKIQIINFLNKILHNIGATFKLFVWVKSGLHGEDITFIPHVVFFFFLSVSKRGLDESVKI